MNEKITYITRYTNLHPKTLSLFREKPNVIQVNFTLTSFTVRIISKEEQVVLNGGKIYIFSL